MAATIPTMCASTFHLSKPLGNPPANGIKFFATAELLEAAQDRHWLVRMSATIYQHWQKKNANKRLPPLPTISFSPDEKLRVSEPASARCEPPGQ